MESIPTGAFLGIEESEVGIQPILPSVDSRTPNQPIYVGVFDFDVKLMNERVFRVILIDILAKPMVSFILRRREFCA